MSKYYRNFLPVCQGDGPALRQRTGFFPGKSQGSPGFPPGKGPLPAGRTGPSLLHGLNGRLQLFVLLGLQLPGQQLLLILLRQGAQGVRRQPGADQGDPAAGVVPAVDSPMALPSGRSKSTWEKPLPLVCSPATTAPADSWSWAAKNSAAL